MFPIEEQEFSSPEAGSSLSHVIYVISVLMVHFKLLWFKGPNDSQVENMCKVFCQRLYVFKESISMENC